MSVRVCTLMWGSAWERYGSIFAETYQKYWDPNIEVALVTDKSVNFNIAQQIDLHSCQDYQFFIEKWNKTPVEKTDIRKKDFWKYDAVKWLPQAITPKIVLEKNPHWTTNDILVWMDADCEFCAPVNEQWIEDVLGDAECAVLQRPNLHSEIGFYAVRISDKTKKALYKFADLYTSYDLFKYKEWHSAYAWDIAMEQFDINIKN